MSDVYAARSNAKKHIIEQCANCNVKKNSNGLYNHDDIVKAKETIEGVLKEVFLQHISGEKMIKLLEINDNPINITTTTQMVTVEMLLNQSKKEAAIATVAAKKVAKTLGTDEVVIPVMTRDEANREADKQNIANQTIIGTKVGLVEIMKRLIGGDILDTVTKIADGSRDKSIDDYKLHEVFQLAFDNAVRPEVDDVLDIVIEMYQSDFDFRAPIKHSIAQLKMTANKLKPFGLNPGEPELMLIILANIHYAKEQVWGHEFRAAMAAIRKNYNYDHIHDKHSWAFIVKELAGADELRNMKLAPAPNVNKANAVNKYKSALDEWSNASLAESSLDSYHYESDFDSSQEACMRVVEQQERRDKKERKKLKRLIGGDILDTVTKIADGSRDKSIDDYKLHEVFQLAFDNAIRPEVDDVLDTLVEMYQFDFDLRLPIKHNVAQLKTMATKLKPFGINPGEPELTLIILANIHYAKEQVWGHEFRAAMAAIRKNYNYDHIHDATSMAFIVKELAGADKLRNMKLAPAPNVNKANAVNKYKSVLEDASWSKSSIEDSSMDSYKYGSDFDSSQEECMRVVEQQERRDKKERKKLRENKQYKSKSIAKSSDTSSDEESEVPLTCKYCIKYAKKQHPKHVTPDTCMYNKKVRRFRYNSVCKKMNLKYIDYKEFKTGEEDQWPKHKKWEGKKEDN